MGLKQGQKGLGGSMARGIYHLKKNTVCLGLLSIVSNSNFSLYPPSFSHDISFNCLWVFFKNSMISSRKGERQKRDIRGDSWAQQAEEQGTGCCCNSSGRSYHSKHSFPWMMLSCPLPCLPPFSNCFRTEYTSWKTYLCGFLSIWIISHL